MSVNLQSRVTIVVITRDRRSELLRTLGELVALPDRPSVIVVDNASRDGTVTAVRRAHRRVMTVPLEYNAGAAARNVGTWLASTPYVGFCDDDTWWAAGALEQAAGILDAEPETAVVTGRVLVGPQQVEDPTCAVMAESPLPRDGSAGIPVVGFLAGASVVRRAAVLSAGGFPSRYLIGGEEELLAIDLTVAGWRLSYVPELVAHHHPSPVRDMRLRHRLLLRNRLWTAWLRRPAPVAWSRTVQSTRQAPNDVAGPALRAALRGLPWVARARAPVPDHVEQMLLAVEGVASSA